MKFQAIYALGIFTIFSCANVSRHPSSIKPLDKELFDAIYEFESSPQEHVEKIRKLIEKGANVSAVDEEAGLSVLMANLWSSSSSSTADKGFLVTQLLLKNGAKIDYEAKWGGTAFNVAIQGGDLRQIQAIAKAGGKVNKSSPDAVSSNRSNPGEVLNHFPAESGEIELNQDLFRSAAYYANTKLLEFLLQKGMSLDMKGYRGSGPLHWAAASNAEPINKPNFRIETINFLVDKGVSINQVDEDGKTPLHVSWEFPVAMRALIAKGADVNAKNSEGNTLLMHWIDIQDFARMNAEYLERSLPRVRALIKAGAKTNLPYKDGGTVGTKIAAAKAKAEKERPEDVIYWDQILTAIYPKDCKDLSILELVQRYFDAVDKRRNAYAEILRKQIEISGCGELLREEAGERR